MEIEADLKEKRTLIYYLSKEKRKADRVAYDSVVEPKMRQTVIDNWNKFVVSILNSRVVPTVVLTSSKLESLYEGISRYQVLSESVVQSDASIGESKMHDWTLNLTENQANHLYFSYHAAVLNFIGNLSRITTGMKGHTRKRLKPLPDRMKSIRHGSILVVDEQNTTVTCSSCFGSTWKQKIYKNGQWREVKGTVVCCNDKYPRRFYSNVTTINRD
ncbi:hypothetical protein K501DRAFT_271343 [Backusella circina FSU 941]|nr:hypothetical protein K501DRAFT_271343 [Backusella circina FSU 941]